MRINLFQIRSTFSSLPLSVCEYSYWVELFCNSHSTRCFIKLFISKLEKKNIYIYLKFFDNKTFNKISS